ncbi:FHY3/FAR1 family [Trema orientale]|uniref:FHY3/FAR1 family n=1 Tax=Trema orientale TaxID=63057 RepID=A0A2P5DUM6_TREOI|nr:FHY3/FAR1 family [Trema orientale]
MPNRKKRPEPITRTSCQAAIQVIHLKDSEHWQAKEFVPTHNHERASVAELQFLRSNRVVTDLMLAQVMSMIQVGIKTSQIMSHIALQSSGYIKLPCQLRDIYNNLAGARREQ